jgi:hypothetical protein
MIKDDELARLQKIGNEIKCLNNFNEALLSNERLTDINNSDYDMVSNLLKKLPATLMRNFLLSCHKALIEESSRVTERYSKEFVISEIFKE